MLEAREFSAGRTALAVLGTVVGVYVALAVVLVASFVNVLDN
jgi:hypothetical protein